jgi:hypothetical protein
VIGFLKRRARAKYVVSEVERRVAKFFGSLYL